MHNMALATLCAVLLVLGGAAAMDEIPGVADSAPQPPSLDPQGANQGAFPHYYNAGMPNEDDLVRFDAAASGNGPVQPEPPPPELGVNQSAYPDVYNDALLLQSKSALEIEMSRTRAALNLIRSYCESNELDDAAEIFASMPPFGDNILINQFRADAANLLILAYCRGKDLKQAKLIYDSMPKQIPGDAAMLAKGRALINLATYNIVNEEYTQAYDTIMDIGWIRDRGDLNEELFKVMARMIPYLDNAGEAEKARGVYDLLVRQVQSPETARLFADNFPSLPRYFLQYARKASGEKREQRLQSLRHIFDSLERLSDDPEIAVLWMNLAGELVDIYTEIGDREQARHFYEIMQTTDKKALLGR